MVTLRAAMTATELLMHELSICQSLLFQLAALVAKHDAIGVERIQVQVGLLAGVEPELLQRAFDVARAGSCAAQALLTIDVMPVVVRCNACDCDSQAVPNRVVCGQCGDYRVRVVRGDELRLSRVHLQLKPQSLVAIH